MRKWKRIIDVTGSFFLLVVLSPIMGLVVIYIKVFSPRGQVVFRSQRLGLDGNPFIFLKFRTMEEGNHDSHADYLKTLIFDGETPMRKQDVGNPRLKLWGKLLRFTSLDELPQLLNVLRGDMSIVGPRPCTPYEADSYEPWHKKRFSVMQGITGLWQVSGKNKLTFRQMIELDIRYAESMSLGLDILIMLKTIPTILNLAIEPIINRMKGEYGFIQQERTAVKVTVKT